MIHKRLRNIVHNFKHTFTYIETTVTNCVNDMTHTDEADRAALSTLRAVCRGVVQFVHTVTLAQGPRSVFPSHPWS